MRLVIARCSVDYAGRLAAHLPEANRLIMVKADGCVAIHADGHENLSSAIPKEPDELEALVSDR